MALFVCLLGCLVFKINNYLAIQLQIVNKNKLQIKIYQFEPWEPNFVSYKGQMSKKLVSKHKNLFQ